MRKWGCAAQPLVEGGDDLLLHTVDGFDVTGRDGAPGCGAAPGAAPTARHGTRGRGRAVDCGITAGLSGGMSRYNFAELIAASWGGRFPLSC